MSDDIRRRELLVDDIVDGEDNLEEKTRKDADNRMYFLGWLFSTRT